jgi:glycosyltransferase involved in cell wall biosynthesis
MTNGTPKIVVVTPVKNEAWILDRFLSVTSRFADHIIIADQKSTDESVAICGKHPKVTLIENESEDYDEASRQILLINEARNLVKGPRIILALDADEILAADATKQPGWQAMLKAKPGTVLCFEKPDLYLTPDLCIRYNEPWPLGYVDDGKEHKAKKVHSIRIPQPDGAPKADFHDVKILHYGLARPTAQTSKIRWYSVVENVLKTSPLLRRRRSYSADKDYLHGHQPQPAPVKWFAGWEEIGIDMRSIPEQKYYWWDFDVLRYFEKYGPKRFWFEDIWKFDWEACRMHARAQGISGIPESRLVTPPRTLALSMKLMTKLYIYASLIKNSIAPRKA